MGMRLVSVHSKEENDFIATQLAQGKCITVWETINSNKSLAWIGYSYFTSGTDFGRTQFSFFWLGTGQELSFTNWGSNEPSNGDYHCLLYSGSVKKWTNLRCAGTQRFICEKRMSECEKCPKYQNRTTFSRIEKEFRKTINERIVHGLFWMGNVSWSTNKRTYFAILCSLVCFYTLLSCKSILSNQNIETIRIKCNQQAKIL